MHILKLFIVDMECFDFVLNFLILYYFECLYFGTLLPIHKPSGKPCSWGSTHSGPLDI